MGCISSKILTRSGSLQEKANQGFQRSGLVEDIILSNSKSSGDQFLALLRTSSAAARRSKADVADHSTAPAAAASKIETINVSDLLAGLEEEEYNTAEEEDEERERRDDRMEGARISPRCLSDGAAGSARSFRTLEEFDAMVTRCSSPEQAGHAAVLAPEPDVSVSPPAPPPPESSSSEQEGPATALAPEPDTSVFLLPQPPAENSSSEQDAVATATSATPGQVETRGAKRRARARQLGELSAPAPAGFDFSKSGSLRDWLLGGGQIFSPGSYATPKFGKVAAVPSASEEHGERRAVFDPELVAQLEEAMEELSVDEERVLREVLEAIEAGETEGTERLERLVDRAAPPVVAVQD
jgi:tricin synthase